MALASYSGLSSDSLADPVVLGILLSFQGVSKVLTSCMACRGSAVRIRLAPLIESLPLEGFSSFWDYLRSL